MSSIWTPSGEHRVPDDDPRAAPRAPGAADAGAGAGGASSAAVEGSPQPTGSGSNVGVEGGDDYLDGGPPGPPVTPEELEAMRQVHLQIRSTPAVDVVANHVVQLFELALIYLGVTTPPDDQGRVPMPDLAQAGVAIDAMSALIDGFGPRLNEHEQTLRDGLGQIQMLYVQVADQLQDHQT